MCVNADQRERAQAQQPDMAQMQACMVMMMQQQTQMLALLAQQLTNKEAANTEQPKAKGKAP